MTLLWSKNKLLQIASTTRKKTFAIGETIFKEGDATDCFYFLIEGKFL